MVMHNELPSLIDRLNNGLLSHPTQSNVPSSLKNNLNLCCDLTGLSQSPQEIFAYVL